MHNAQFHTSTISLCLFFFFLASHSTWRAQLLNMKMNGMVRSSWSNVDFSAKLFQQVHTSFTRRCLGWQITNSPGIRLMPDCVTHWCFLHRKTHKCSTVSIISQCCNYQFGSRLLLPGHKSQSWLLSLTRKKCNPNGFHSILPDGKSNWMEGRSILHLWTEKAGSISPIINPLVSPPSHRPLRRLTNGVRSPGLGWCALLQSEEPRDLSTHGCVNVSWVKVYDSLGQFPPWPLLMGLLFFIYFSLPRWSRSIYRIVMVIEQGRAGSGPGIWWCCSGNDVTWN